MDRHKRVVLAVVLSSLLVSCGAPPEDAAEPAGEGEIALAASDVPAAVATLTNVVIPNLEHSTGYALASGDNLARMSIVRRSLTIALNLLALPTPEPVRAATVLRTAAIPVLETSPGYRKILAGNPNGFWQTKMGIARKGLDTAITQLTGSTAPTSQDWSVFIADSAGARAKLTGTVIPNLVASTAFGYDSGDNLARMSIVKRELQIAADLLALPVPDPGRAHAVLAAPTIAVLKESPGYKKVLAGNPQTFATTKLGIAMKGLDFTMAKTTASPVVFMEPGVFIVDGSLWSAANKASLLRQAGFGWVAIKIHHGPMKTGDQYLQQNFVQAYHAWGIQVGGWGYETTDPAADAAAAAQQIQAYGLDFYLADVEAEYKYTSPSGAPDPVAYGRSKTFVQAFRALEPSLPAAVSTFGDRSDVEHLVDIDYAQFRAAGFDLMQQAYWNDYEFYRPSRCVRAALNDGWPINRIHPTFGIWGGGQTRIVSAQEYIGDVTGTGIYGYSTFIGDQMNDSDVPILGTGVPAGLAR